jgi:branched-subunit amino acid aminotransferase/4-amino-4-deoxychorismate lyase
MLEGPTFSVGWIVEGALETPSLDLGILGSITRTSTLEEAAKLGLEIREVRQPVTRLDRASEFFVLSTVREVMPVRAVGDRTFPIGELTRQLAASFRRRAQAEAHSI